MPDYIYLLENRLSADQRHALAQLRETARKAGTLIFLTGDPVRDLTSGHTVRNIEVAVQSNALKLKKTLEKEGAKVWGEHEPSRSLYMCFPGTVRVDVISTHRIEYPRPGKPVYHFASIQEDLRRRDFTVNSMAVSLNEGSFGLLMDPLNGAADIESRTLRLVSNYGFLEEPSLMIRATRYRARLGWEFDPRTQMRYENAKAEGVIEHLSPHARSQELEQIGYEEEGLKVLEALEAEGWMKHLYPAWTSARADREKLKSLHDLAVELLLQGVHADMSAAQMELLTSGMAAKDLNALKKLLLRPGFVEEWKSLDTLAAGFAKILLAKQNASPSAAYKLFTSYDPEAVLWLGFTSKQQAVQERYNQFMKVWPETRQRIPYALMQEMRITPELPNYNHLVRAIFFELIDGKLTAPEEMRAYLEPHSPPAPPPRVSIKRPRARRGGEARMKEAAYEEGEESSEVAADDEDVDEIGNVEDEEIDLGMDLGHSGLGAEIAEDEEEAEEEDGTPASVKHSAQTPAMPARAPKAQEQAPEVEKKKAPQTPGTSETATKAQQPAKPKASAASASAASNVKAASVKTGPSKPAPVTTKPATKKALPAAKKTEPAAKKALPAAKGNKPAAPAAAGKAAVKPSARASSKAAAAIQKPAGAAKAKSTKPPRPAQKKSDAKTAKKR